jgi:tetrahydromethanopterin S-methyltransferase subunit C
VKHLLPVLLVAVGLVIGAAGIVHGEADDSPGLQALGALVVLAAVAYGVRTVRRSG